MGKAICPIKEILNADPGETILPITDSVVPGIIPDTYFISDFGNVYNLTRISSTTKSYKMSPDTSTLGGSRVRIRRINLPDSREVIARMVVKTFVPWVNIDDRIVWFKDGDRTNNRLDNLVYMIRPIHEFPLYPGEEIRLLTEKEVPGIIPNTYFITNYGRAFSATGHNGSEYVELVRSIADGYVTIVMYTPDTKQIARKAHRLVMYAFRWFDGCNEKLDLYNYKYQVNHKMINGVVDPTDNYVDPNGIIENDHIEWCDNMYNNHYSYAYGKGNENRSLTNSQVLEIIELGKSGVDNESIANMFNTNPRTVSKILNKEIYRDITDKENFFAEMEKLRRELNK